MRKVMQVIAVIAMVAMPFGFVIGGAWIIYRKRSQCESRRNKSTGEDSQ